MPRKEQFELDLLALALTLERLDARKGVAMTMSELAKELDWSLSRLKHRITWAHSHPEYGLAVHVQRGAQRLIILTYDGKADSIATPAVVQMSIAERRENVSRTCRSACKVVLHELATDLRRTAGKELSREAEVIVGFLRNMRIILRSDEEANRPQIVEIDRVLAIVDGRWSEEI